MTATTRRVVEEQMTEKAFTQMVMDAARLAGWNAYHTHDSRRSAPGFPDLVLVRRGRIVFAELKVKGRKPSPYQRYWLDQLAEVRFKAEQPFGYPVRVFLWRPEDWNCIEAVLSGDDAWGDSDDGQWKGQTL